MGYTDLGDRRCQELHTETFNLKIMAAAALINIFLGITFLIIFLTKAYGTGSEELPIEDFLYLILALSLVSTGGILVNLTKMKVSVTADSVLASLGLFKFNLSFGNVESVSVIEDPRLLRGGWGVRSRLQKEGWAVSYTVAGYKRLKFSLKNGKYKVFLLSTAEPEKILKIFKGYKR